MSEILWASFHLDDTLPELQVSYDPSVTLPPDSASVSMVGIAAGMLRRAKTAQQLYTGERPDTVHVVDFGTGNGVIGATMLVAPEVTAVTCIDNDPATLPFARQNVTAALKQYREAGSVACTVLQGDWHDWLLWRALNPADLIINNPPYLLPDETIRAGYEQTPSAHLYAPNREALAATYAALITNGVRRMRHWDIMAIRLPVGDNIDTTGKWTRMAAEWTDAGARANNEGEAYYVFHSQRVNGHTERPLHLLTIEKLPTDYPATNPSSDVRVDYFLQHGRDPGQLHDHPQRQPNDMISYSDVT